MVHESDNNNFDDDSDGELIQTTAVPLLPLRDVVVYPNMVIPLFVGRQKSVNALNIAMQQNKRVFLVAQKAASKDEPHFNDIYNIGTIATVLQLLKLPDGTVKVLVEGMQRAKLKTFYDEDDYFSADVTLLSNNFDDHPDIQGLIYAVNVEFEHYVKLNSKIPPEILSSLIGIDDPARLADTIVAHMALKVAEKQRILELLKPSERLEQILSLMEAEIDVLQLEKRIRGRVKSQMESNQREYYLNEQMKAIQKELGDASGNGNDFDNLQARIDKAGMSKEAKEKALAELKKLRQMAPMAAEATVTRNYLDCLIDLPWKASSRLSKDLEKAETILDADHYGLEKIKERIIEYLAVQKRVKKLKGPILCLVGPPGVGKTSLGKSIARATGRKFARMALGGVRDEAEIRGHRRTYIGSLPGKIIQKLSKAEVRNPLFLLDEIDKMAMDFRGDPASALLEVLDPEQNNAFNDHYLEVDFDLSDVMFICTANSMDIPAPLLDRMEVIRLSGYTEDEKLNIAKQYLLPKQFEQNGLKTKELSVSDKTILDIVRYYTREAGVRSLEREIAKICRKAVRSLQKKNSKKKAITVTGKNLETFLGVKKYRYGLADETDQVGHVTGLAWTEVGGELLHIEVAVMSGKGKATSTGSLGDVMQESIQAATTVVRARSQQLGLRNEYFEKHDFHVHVPAGATPKDGPSAGIGMCTALASALTNIPVKADVAMTGEITLRGEVLPIGGLKEKLLAALRGGIKTVVIPHENERDLKEIPDNILKGLTIKPVRWIDEVLAIALQEVPTPLSDEEFNRIDDSACLSQKATTQGSKHHH